MAKDSSIAWTTASFNMVTGCKQVSPGCLNCYAMRDPHARPFWGLTDRQTRADAYWKAPHLWNRKALASEAPTRVFAGSYCDVFEAHVTVDRERARLWPLMKATRGLRWLLLTKRPERIVECLPEDFWESSVWGHVWLGTSVEDQQRADERLLALSEVPGRTFVSVEPLLGPIDPAVLLTGGGVQWVICGGESGPERRRMDPEWAAEIQDFCVGHRIPFFYKQDGGPKPDTIAHPERWRREFPEALTEHDHQTLF